MERRDFLKNTLNAGAAILVGQAAGTAVAGEARRASRHVDPEQMVRAARKYFLNDHRSCSEAMLLVGSQALGIDSPLIPDIALGLSSGLGKQGHTCGVILGAAMVASLAAAQRERDRARKKKAVSAAVAKICSKFEKQHGSIECRALIGLDLATPEGKTRHKAGIRGKRCGQFVETGARLMAEMLACL
ncbi:C_GCAxxG_C_C family protein [PVC group bacterium]|nr:C_GCAxxG_C_C family protein [PVC group bacterium]